ncbi:MAG: cytochrome c [Candidatus Kapabacteria bacterium]|nr:cytochrome c [Ignavibacteria bacterium]MBP6509313.1 cytochrome c [Candidatus Kapabacteria bacterium]MBK6419816.1 cytochrome c [Ignavibacteria bacterium]MBK6759553.1 cytochrome c [Ignavibacteria bacterium]MBK7033264.1 cytochrome c [Ignavibacteria bacterium]
MKTTLYSKLLGLSLMLLMAAGLVACSQDNGDKKEEAPSFMETQQEKKTYGKIQKVDVGPNIDATMSKAGKETFEVKCTACHKYDERYVGPALGKVTERRTPEYIMNMILDTETMIENDDTVKCLLQEFMMKMPNQSVDEKDARSVLEHLREHAATAK